MLPIPKMPTTVETDAGPSTPSKSVGKRCSTRQKPATKAKGKDPKTASVDPTSSDEGDGLLVVKKQRTGSPDKESLN